MLAPARYKGAHGGRGSGKSHFFAERLIEECVADPTTRAVCIREVQKSIDKSVRQLLVDKIKSMGVSACFEILDTEIHVLDDEGQRCGLIIFQGMQNHTADSIKSLEGFRIAWVEEAQSLSKRSLELLTPTLRIAGAEIWFSWNPRFPTDPVDAFMRSEDAANDEEIVCVEVNFTDNPWFDQTELRGDMERDRRTDLEKYAHVWLGKYVIKTEAQVLRGRCRIDNFVPQPEWNGPYHGADWGFSVDPTALVKLWIDGRKLYIEAEAYGHQVDTDDMPELFSRIAGSKLHTIRADCSRPEMSSYMRRHGYPKCIDVEKWPGSVEDGVEHLRSYEEIILHPSCVNAAAEALAWSWKTDRLTGDVLPELKPGNDHIWDAARYALAPIIKGGRAVKISDDVLAQLRTMKRR